MNRNNKTDWEQIWNDAKTGELDNIPADVKIRCYNQLKRIEKDHMEPEDRPGLEVRCYWGVSGSGKTYLAR